MIRFSLIAIALGVLMPTGVHAAEIKALVSTAMKAPFTEIVAQFEKTTGHKVTVTFGPTGRLTKLIADGEAAEESRVAAPAGFRRGGRSEDRDAEGEGGGGRGDDLAGVHDALLCSVRRRSRSAMRRDYAGRDGPYVRRRTRCSADLRVRCFHRFEV